MVSITPKLKPMKKTSLVITIAAGIIAFSIFNGCKKDTTTQPSNPASRGEYYTSVQNFLKINAAPMQGHALNVATGGSFTTPQGTVVSIPANAFTDWSNNPVTGTVTIEFKDIYTRSEMLFSDMPTVYNNTTPLKSGGEFYINARQGSTQLKLAPTAIIQVTQPLQGWAFDNQMGAFKARTNDSIGWVGAADSSNVGPSYVDSTLSGYVFSLFSFNSPVDTGSWCNSDNASYFASYPQTTLTLKGTDSASVYGTDVFLVFQGVNSMVHVYNSGYSSFTYNYAPQGLQCTVVAVGVKDSTAYSAFVPITIGSNQTVNFTLSKTNSSTFKSQLNAIK